MMENIYIQQPKTLTRTHTRRHDDGTITYNYNYNQPLKKI